MRAFGFFALILTLSTPLAHGLVINEYVFGSKYDYFSLKRSGSRYKVDGKVVKDLGAFSEFVDLFTEDVDVECPSLPKKPDLTVRAKTRAEVIVRQFYIKQKVVKAGDACLEISGQGIFFLPMHRNWFIGGKSSRVKFGKKLILKKDGADFLSFTNRYGEWVQEDPSFIVHWTFFENFMNALTSFRIDARLHPGIAKELPDLGDSPKFSLHTGSDSYFFYRVSENLWAMKKDKINWLISSNSWALFEGMSEKLWTDPNAPKIRALLDKSLEDTQRLGSLDSLKSFWSKSIRIALQSIVLDPDESKNMKLKVIQRIRRKPSDDNFYVLAQALSQTNSQEVQAYIVKTLRIRNPKGPAINADDDPEVVEKHIKTWQKWSRDFRKKK